MRTDLPVGRCGVTVRNPQVRAVSAFFPCYNDEHSIPTMVHDGKPLHESGTICEYLDESYPDPPLRHETPYDRALMRNWVRHVDERIHNLIVFNWRHSFGAIASKWTDEELEVFARDGTVGHFAGLSLLGDKALLP